MSSAYSLNAFIYSFYNFRIFENFTPKKRAYVKCSTAFEAYTAHCLQKGLTPLNESRFGYMLSKCYPTVKNKRVMEKSDKLYPLKTMNVREFVRVNSCLFHFGNTFMW